MKHKQRLGGQSVWPRYSTTGKENCGRPPCNTTTASGIVGHDEAQTLTEDSIWPRTVSTAIGNEEDRVRSGNIKSADGANDISRREKDFERVREAGIINV